jgi:hypothetical protein
MPALDTNVLVRYLVKDDSGQLAAARQLIAQCIAEGHTLFVPVTVALELEWVLRASYGLAKAESIDTLSRLFSAVELSFESEAALEVRCSSTAPEQPTSPIACISRWPRGPVNCLCGPSTSARRGSAGRRTCQLATGLAD